MRNPRLPDIVYVGYQKTGSAFLRSYFEFHPEITWSRNATAFNFSETTARAADYLATLPIEIPTKCYIDMFEGLATGVAFKERELTPGERFVPGFYPAANLVDIDVQKTAKFVHDVLSEARIIISIRNQVDWLTSNWNHFVNWLPDGQKGFEDFLSTFEGKGLLHSGCFERTITAFQNQFGPENVFVIPLEMLSQNRDEALKNLCSFLDVEYIAFSEERADKNTGRDKTDLILRRHANRTITQSKGVKKLYRFIKPLLAALVGPFNRNAISESDRRMLEAFYGPSNRASSHATSIDLEKLGYPI